MILYHTSDRVVALPNVEHSRLFLDFGKGFYVTPNRLQAEKYARRFFKEGRRAFLNIYEFDDAAMFHCDKKIFSAYDGMWLDYVVACRKNNPHEYFDIVEGGIADDDVFNTLDLYMSELIAKEEAIKRLKKKKPNVQICFCNQHIIDKHMHFIESIELHESE